MRRAREYPFPTKNPRSSPPFSSISTRVTTTHASGTTSTATLGSSRTPYGEHRRPRPTSTHIPPEAAAPPPVPLRRQAPPWGHNPMPPSTWQRTGSTSSVTRPFTVLRSGTGSRSSRGWPCASKVSSPALMSAQSCAPPSTPTPTRPTRTRDCALTTSP
ncbi:hypothetical protein BN1708_016254 [Verticillium longisporum]|uniref:Uncharacterized protein n=1 Tax=Verticillium longisporum TaxID=100787 RepID=A0A0G4MHG1_VERLO|nr:hypothetical protein BN1708_016254 [Verticillium longisporum]